MASGDRLQIVLEAKDEMTQEIGKARRSIKALESEQKRYEAEVESGNKDAAESYDRVRREVQRQEAALTDLRAEQKIVAREANKLAREEAEARVKAKLAAREQFKAQTAIHAATRRATASVKDQTSAWDAMRSKADTALRSVGQRLGVVDRQMDSLGDSTRGASNGIDHMGDRAKSGKAGFAGFAATLKGGGIAAAATGAALLGTAFAIQRVAQASWAAANQAAAYEKKVRRTDVVFGQYAGRVRRWADESNEMWGKSVDDVAAMAAGVGDILKPLGFTTQEATKLTLGVGDLIPALAEWNTVGMDAEQVSYALTAAMTGEREMLKSLGIVIMEEDVKAKVAAMEAAGKFTDETDKQRKAIATLKLAVEGSTDALKAQNDGATTVTRTMNKFRAVVADVRDAGLGIIAEAINNLAGAFESPGLSKKPGALVWIQKNRDELVEGLMTMAGGALRFGQFATTAFAGVAYALGALNLAMEPVYAVMSLMPGAVGRTGKALQGSSLKMFDAAGKALELSDGMGKIADKAFGARDGVRELNSQLDGIKNKKIRAEVEVVITTTQDAVDAAVRAAKRAARNTPGGGDFGTRFAGGPVMAGGTYVVGELGPEMMVPNSGSPFMVGESGPEVRDFATSGFVVPNHLLDAVGGSSTTVVRERIVERGSDQPLVGQMVVRDDREAVRELERMQARQRRLERERV